MCLGENDDLIWIWQSEMPIENDWIEFGCGPGSNCASYKKSRLSWSKMIDELSESAVGRSTWISPILILCRTSCPCGQLHIYHVTFSVVYSRQTMRLDSGTVDCAKEGSQMPLALTSHIYIRALEAVCLRSTHKHAKMWVIKMCHMSENTREKGKTG